LLRTQAESKKRTAHTYRLHEVATTEEERILADIKTLISLAGVKARLTARLQRGLDESVESLDEAKFLVEQAKQRWDIKLKLNPKRKDDGLEKKVREIVRERLGVDDNFAMTDNFSQRLNADSLDTVALIMDFEKQFGFEVPDEDAEKLTTTQAVVDYLREHLSEERIAAGVKADLVAD